MTVSALDLRGLERAASTMEHLTQNGASSLEPNGTKSLGSRSAHDAKENNDLNTSTLSNSLTLEAGMSQPKCHFIFELRYWFD